MFSKLVSACRIFAESLWLVAALTLTFALPVECARVLFVERYSAQVEAASPAALATGACSTLALAVFSAIAYAWQSAAVIAAMAARQRGEPLRYTQALAAARTSWLRLLGASIVAGLLIALGTVALIIPGLILAVRWFLFEYAVVLEGAGVRASLRRSSVLTRGFRWQILGAGLILAVGLLAVMLAAGAGLGLLREDIAPWERPGAAWADILASCLGAILTQLGTALGLAFYLEAYDQEQTKDLSVACVVPVAAGPAGPPTQAPCPNPACGRLNPPGARFCSYCGTPL